MQIKAYFQAPENYVLSISVIFNVFAPSINNRIQMETFTRSVVEFVRNPDSLATGFLVLAIASLVTSCILIPSKNDDYSTLH